MLQSFDSQTQWQTISICIRCPRFFTRFAVLTIPKCLSVGLPKKCMRRQGYPTTDLAMDHGDPSLPTADQCDKET